MENKCENCTDQRACVPFFEHENTLMHYNASNRRMLIALLTVCVTFIVTIIVFVVGYTIREQNWLNTITEMNRTPEATNAVYEQPNQSVD